MATTECPRCDAPLANPNLCAACGWKPRTRETAGKAGKAKGVEREHVACAHEDCRAGAICRIQTATGWANLCLPHYEAHYQRQALRTYADLGLERWADESHADHRKRVFEYIGLMARTARMSRPAYEPDVDAA